MWYANGWNEYEIPRGWHCAFGCHDLITDTEFDAILQIETVPEPRNEMHVDDVLSDPDIFHPDAPYLLHPEFVLTNVPDYDRLVTGYQMLFSRNYR